MRMRLVVAVVALGLAGCVPAVEEGASGAEIYEIFCAGCHGPDLEGRVSGPPLGLGSPSSEQPRSYHIATVTNGRSRMPGFADALTPDEIDRVVDFVLSEQGR